MNPSGMGAFLNRFDSSEYQLCGLEKDYLIGEYKVYSSRVPRVQRLFMLKHVPSNELDPAQLDLIYQFLSQKYSGVSDLVSINNRNLGYGEMQLVFSHFAPLPARAMSEAEIWKLAHQTALGMISLESKGLFYPNVSRRYVCVDGQNYKLVSPFAFPKFLRSMFTVMANPVAPMSQRHQLFLSSIKQNILEYCAMLTAIASENPNEMLLASNREHFHRSLSIIAQRYSPLLGFFLKQMPETNSFQSIINFIKSNIVHLPKEFQDYLNSNQWAAEFAPKEVRVSYKSLNIGGLSTLNPPPNPHEVTVEPVSQTPRLAPGLSGSGPQGPKRFGETFSSPILPSEAAPIPKPLAASVQLPGVDQKERTVRAERISDNSSLKVRQFPVNYEPRSMRFSNVDWTEAPRVPSIGSLPPTSAIDAPSCSPQPFVSSAKELYPVTPEQNSTSIKTQLPEDTPTYSKPGAKEIKVSYRMNSSANKVFKVVDYDDGSSDQILLSENDRERLKGILPTPPIQAQVPEPASLLPKEPLRTYQLSVVKGGKERLLYETVFLDRSRTNQESSSERRSIRLPEKSKLRSSSIMGSQPQPHQPYLTRSFQNLDVNF